MQIKVVSTQEQKIARPIVEKHSFEKKVYTLLGFVTPISSKRDHIDSATAATTIVAHPIAPPIHAREAAPVYGFKPLVTVLGFTMGGTPVAPIPDENAARATGGVSGAEGDAPNGVEDSKADGAEVDIVTDDGANGASGAALDDTASVTGRMVVYELMTSVVM
ncbi:MAG: hypothetical protein M1818_008308 [Claussenomyces sp. TS43310]|nr:MAG: hypothetical protein M1818_008308 [Claussenomyces sp. TS43310]